MNISQRQESPNRTISGKKIKNFFTCTVKQIRSLSPPVYQNLCRQQTFQTDSFKQILTKRSVIPANKENMSIGNGPLKKIKEKPLKKKDQENQKVIAKKKRENKSSTVSLNKVFRREKSGENKNSKSMSPSRIVNEYRSGPNEKKNYLSHNISSKTSREVFKSKSMKNLMEKNKNQTKSVLTFYNKQEKKINKDTQKKIKQKKDQCKKKKLKNKKQTHNYTHTQSIAKQFDNLLKKKKEKMKNKGNEKENKSMDKKKSKKVIVSNNNSKNFISRQKFNSRQSIQSNDSVEKNMLSRRYDKNKQIVKKQRKSFEPFQKVGKKINKSKTQAFSPQKNLQNKNSSAIKIQKIFRGFITRKYIKEFKKICSAVILIQKCWRGYKTRKRFKQLKLQQQIRKQNNQIIQIKSDKNLERKQKNQTKQIELANLLQQILKQENVNQSIKLKISDFLKKDNESNYSSAQKMSSAKSHNELQMQSEKRYFEIQKKKYRFGSPAVLSQRLDLIQLQKSPQLMVQNLLAIKNFQRQKLITNAKMQIQGIENLTIKKLFSPRTRDAKKNEINKKLEQQLQKFDQSMSEVIKSCKDSQNIIGQIKPFRFESTPQKQYDQKIVMQNLNSPKISEKNQNAIQNSQQKLHDLSMQLLQYYEQKTQSKQQKQYRKLNPKYEFIQEYLLNLFEYIRQMGHQYRQNFIMLMKSNRNLDAIAILKNLNVLTEQSDDEDISFKLPLYKYLQQEQTQILARKIVQEFNNSYLKLQRHQFQFKHIIQDIYLKMILDAFNEALNLQRPIHYIFTESSIIGRSNQKRIMQMQGLDAEDNEPQFSFYFANSMNHIYKWAHIRCGRIDNEIDQQTLTCLNQAGLKQFLNNQAVTKSNYYDELLQVIAALSDCLFEQIMMEFMEDSAPIYL